MFSLFRDNTMFELFKNVDVKHVLMRLEGNFF